MTTLMRNGRDRRSENPSGPTRYLSAGDCPGPISGSHQGQRPPWLHRDRGNPPSDNRPYTWLHPNASQKSQIPLAPGHRPYMHRGHRPYMARNRSDETSAIWSRSGEKRTQLGHRGSDAVDPSRQMPRCSDTSGVGGEADIAPTSPNRRAADLSPHLNRQRMTAASDHEAEVDERCQCQFMS